jgi:hypothetical protein
MCQLPVHAICVKMLLDRFSSMNTLSKIVEADLNCHLCGGPRLSSNRRPESKVVQTQNSNYMSLCNIPQSHRRGNHSYHGRNPVDPFGSVSGGGPWHVIPPFSRHVQALDCATVIGRLHSVRRQNLQPAPSTSVWKHETSDWADTCRTAHSDVPSHPAPSRPVKQAPFSNKGRWLTPVIPHVTATTAND